MHMPPLETQRLLVRPFTIADLDAVHQILDIEPGDARAGGGDAAAARAERQQWLQWTVLSYEALAKLHQPPYGDRALVLKNNEQVIGACGFAPVLLPFEQLPFFSSEYSGERLPGSPVRNTNEFGLYWAVASAHQRQGYAVEAGRALVEYAFTQLNLKRVVATTTYDNLASIGVMRKLGMHIARNPYPDPPWLQVVGILANT